MPEPAPAPPPAIVSNLVNATFGLWFPFFRWCARTLPTAGVARLAEATVERAIWRRDSVREAILDNYAAVLGLPRNAREVERAGREMVSRHSRLWIDLLRYSGRSDVDPATLVSRPHRRRAARSRRTRKGRARSS